YNGQETEESLGLNVTEMSFRQYDPAIGRFNSIDRLAELALGITPFRFAFNNPIAFNDPTGLMETINGESLGADGITNSQWLALSRPGGGGFDAIAKQKQQNSCELRGGKNCNPQDQSQQIPFINGRKKNKVDLPEGIIDFDAAGKTEDELFRIYDFDGRTTHAFYFSYFLENEIAASNGGLYFTRSGIATTISGGLLYGFERTVSNSRFWIDAKGNIKSTKLLERGTNGRFVRGVQGLRNGRASAARVAGRYNIAGKFVGGVGVLITGYQYFSGQINGTEAIVDSVMGAIGILGGLLVQPLV
ncbi:MAG: RHS repeat-associated core domain-containing protein, partial [Flavobacterium sp.]|nr:RHS repeat-associated core domain-containing protein [Flavobacterium sp.]